MLGLEEGRGQEEQQQISASFPPSFPHILLLVHGKGSRCCPGAGPAVTRHSSSLLPESQSLPSPHSIPLLFMPSLFQRKRFEFKFLTAWLFHSSATTLPQTGWACCAPCSRRNKAEEQGRVPQPSLPGAFQQGHEGSGKGRDGQGWRYLQKAGMSWQGTHL